MHKLIGAGAVVETLKFTSKQWPCGIQRQFLMLSVTSFSFFIFILHFHSSSSLSLTQVLQPRTEGAIAKVRESMEH